MRFTSLALVLIAAAGVVGTTGCSSKKKSNTLAATAAVSSGSTATTGSGTTGATTSGSTAPATSSAPVGGSTGTLSNPGGGSSTTAGGNTSSGSSSSGSTGSGFFGGTGRFVDATAMLPDTTAADWGADAGDLDGDGRIDIAIAVNNGPPRVLFNEGLRFVERTGAIARDSFAATDVRLVDVDKDGDFDLVYSVNFGPARVFLNSGRGVFTLGQLVNPNNDAYTYNAAIGDANGDGWPDLFFANAGQSTPSRGQNRLFLNDGTGRYAEAPQGSVPAIANDSLDATFLDVNGDGHLDVFVANFGSPHVLLVNDGTGRYMNQSDVWLPAGMTRNGTAIGQGDIDRDGKIDLFVCNEGAPGQGTPPPGERNSLLIQGTGRFADQTATGLPNDADATFAVRLIDVNGDGQLDAVVSNLRAVQRLYVNQQGVFTDATANFPAVNQTPYNSHGLTIGDFNGDGAPDVFYCRSGRKPWLFFNTR